ncbi:sensor histidine kinase [Mariniluteicoccus flavus]
MLRRIPILDVVLAALFAALAVVECSFLVDFGPRWPYVANAAIHLALVPTMLVRRVRPVAAFVAAYALLAALAALVYASPVNLGVSPALFAAPLALLAITRHGPSPRWGWAALLLGVAGSFISPVTQWGSRWLIGAHLVVLVGCYLWAAQQRNLVERHDAALAAQAREHEGAAARAAEAERTMIAREVHDIVAHNLAVVRVQAATGLALGGEDRLREALTTIRDVTSEALAETRDLVGSLRIEGVEAGPGGDVTALPVVVDRAREAGVGLAVSLPDKDILAQWQERWPARVRLTVVRVVQEAITNLIKHRGHDPAATCVVMEDGGDVVVEVTNASRAEGGEPGHGLTGLRERVELAGGEFTAGAIGDGFRVWARIPIGESS